jgi:hypothetical protein
MSDDVEIETTDTDEAPQNMEAAPVAKKTTKKAAKPQETQKANNTERARAIVRAKLAAAQRPPVNDYR